MRRTVAIAVAAAVMAAATAPAVVGQEEPDHLSEEFLASIDQAMVHGTITPPGAQVHELDTERLAYDDLV